MGLADLVEERCDVLRRLVLAFSPFSNAFVHMVQLFQHLLVQMGLAVRGRQRVFTLDCGKDADAIIHHFFFSEIRTV